MPSIKEVQAIIFDFDGVILESVEVKGWAFGKLFQKFPNHIEQIVAFHNANGGVSRFEKIRYIYKNILNEELNEKQLQKLSKKFEKLVFKRILECDFVPGTLNFLKANYQKIPFFVVSATPHQEIKKIVRTRDINKYFKGVFGSPTTKDVWIEHILSKWKLNKETVIFIGDSVNDLRAAKKKKIFFIGRILNMENNTFLGKSADNVIKNLEGLNKFIKNI